MSVTNTELSKDLQEKLDSFLKEITEEGLNVSTEEVLSIIEQSSNTSIKTKILTKENIKLKESVIFFLTTMGDSIKELMNALAEENINISTYFTEADTTRLSNFMRLIISIIYQPMSGKSTTKFNALLGAFLPLTEPWKQYILQQNSSNSTSSSCTASAPITHHSSTNINPKGQTVRRKSNSNNATTLSAIAEVPTSLVKDGKTLTQTKFIANTEKVELERKLLESTEALDKQLTINQEQTQRIRELEREIKKLQFEKESLKTELSSIEAKHNFSEENNQILLKTINKNNTDNARHIAELQEKLKDKEKELEELILQHKREISHKETEISTITRDLNQKVNECLVLEGENTSLKEKNTTHQQQIEVLLKAAKAHEKEKEKYEATIQSFKIQSRDYIKNLEQSENEKTELWKKLADLTDEFDKQASELEAAKHTIARMSRNPAVDPNDVAFSLSQDLNEAVNSPTSPVITSTVSQPLPPIPSLSLNQQLPPSLPNPVINSRLANILAIFAETSAILSSHVNTTTNTANPLDSSSTSSPTILPSFNTIGGRANSGTNDGTSFMNSANQTDGNAPSNTI